MHYLGEPHILRRILQGKREEDLRVMQCEKHVTCTAALKTEEATTSQAMQEASRGWKRLGPGLFLQPSECNAVLMTP